MSTAAKTLSDSILNHLFDHYTLANGTEVSGQSISFLRNCVRDDGFRFSCLNDFEDECQLLGFNVVPGKNRRGGSARVVTIL